MMPKKKYQIAYINKLLNSEDFKKYKFVYIYSDFRFFLSENKDDIKNFMKYFLNNFLKNDQTIIIPAFSYSKNKYDIKTDRSSVGFFSNYLLKLKGVFRSEHPIFSYAAYGSNKQIVKKIGKSAFGRDSIHERLLFNNCCFLHFGRKLEDGNTMVHHVEQNLSANYRFEKIFKTKVYNNKKYIGSNYSAYVRKNFNKSSLFSFKKALKLIKKENFIVKLNNEENLKSLFYYSYDEMYFFLHNIFILNNKIFLKHN
jgi:aminoglycoside 3-N-acetyltransferase